MSEYGSTRRKTHSAKNQLMTKIILTILITGHYSYISRCVSLTPLESFAVHKPVGCYPYNINHETSTGKYTFGHELVFRRVDPNSTISSVRRLSRGSTCQDDLPV